MNLWQKAVALVRGWSISDPQLVRAMSSSSTSSVSGERVTEGGVLALSAAWACVNLLAGTIGSLPLMVYRTDAKGNRTLAKDHPLYALLHDSPNFEQTALDFWEFCTVALELRGNAIALKEWSGSRLAALVPIGAPVDVRRTERGSLRYRWSENGKRFDEPEENIFHIRGFGGSPLGGLSTLAFGAKAFGLAQAIDTAAGSTFRNGIRPSAQITFPEWLDPENRELVKASLASDFEGAMNAGRPFIGEGGMKLEAISMNLEEAQMLQSRGFSVEEVCRFFGVPPFMIGHTDKSTSWGTGLEQQTLGFQKFTLRRRLRRIEMAAQKQLLTPADRAAGITIEFSIEGLLRGDSKARSEFYNSGLQNGWMTINEVRGFENLPPVDGGDIPRMQMQNVAITAALAAAPVQPPATT